jgi:hypothetical protein
MTDHVQALLDKQSIYEVLVTYCRGVDRCDEDLIRSAFHDDSYDDHGYWNAPDWRKTEVWADRAPPVPTEDFVRGGRRPEDPSYRAAVRPAPGGGEQSAFAR